VDSGLNRNNANIKYKRYEIRKIIVFVGSCVLLGKL